MALFPILLLAIPGVASPAPAEKADAPPLVVLPGMSASADTDAEPPRLAQMTIEQRVIIRIPMMRRPPPPPPEHRMDRERFDDPPEIEWEERKGPKCIKIRKVAAAAITSQRGVDLLMRDHNRLRARLGRGCRPADLYSGFYIQPNDDGELCAGRDRVLARSGADCEITNLLRLVPDR